jgi:hypothetical protein
MPTSPLARARFLSRLEAAEAALSVEDFDALDRLVRELSPLADALFAAERLSRRDGALSARFDAVFAATDRA